MAENKKKPGRPSGSKNKQSRSKKPAAAAAGKKPTGSRVRDEIWAIIIIALGVFLVIALQTHAAGLFGEAVSNLLKGSFGFIAYILPYYLIVYGILLFAKKTIHINGKSLALLLVIFLMLTLLNSLRYINIETFSFSVKEWHPLFNAGAELANGGFFGMMVGAAFVKIIGKWGLGIFAVVVIAIALLLLINTPFSQFFEKMKQKRAEKAELAAIAALAEEEEVPIPKTEEAAKPERKFEPRPKEPPLQAARMSAKEAKVLAKNGLSQGQIKIMSYMKDDSLFEGGPEDKEKGFGLENGNALAQGFGLDGAATAVASCEPEKRETLTNIQINGYADTDFMEPVIPAPAQPEMPLPVKEEKKFIEAAATLTTEEIHSGTVKPNKAYEFPSIDFLNKAKGVDKSNLDNSLQMKAAKLEQTLQNFHVDARVVQVTQGPAVTRYEIQPNVGVKVNSIVRLADDIALNLEAKSIRIEAPIPGKAAVGIEVENDKVNMVTLREIIDSKEFKTSKSKITFAVGKDIAGTSIVADLKSMPHMLIAGSTGSGKSVCINSIITSILYKAKPDEVKLVLIDPKVVELGNYNGIPHLLIPVVTEPSKAAAALNWAVAEMTDRYKKFAEEGVRDLASFNEKVGEKGEEDRYLPQIVIIIDELADLMMAAPSQVEESICRLAQMARAAGMHLIVATQRPSVDIITGVIKANIPSRIAFAVSSQFDSRTILDMAGAEKLVGKGDMLFNPLGMGKPVRVQGCFVSDTEVHKVIEHVKGQITEVEYSHDVIHTIEKANTAETGDDGDELLADAIETVVKTGQASVSMLQRRFRVGYNRAARIVDMMEARGIIGPADGSRPRQVLMTEDELYELGKDTEDLE